MDWVRKDGSNTRITRRQVNEAVDAELKRLKTDYIDILQFQWPERYSPWQGATFYEPEMERNDISSIREQLEIISELKNAGKIRHFGLSNESPYGIGAFTMASDCLGLPRPISCQLPYNILERTDFERWHAEAASRYAGDIALIAHSPLAGGVLTNKYKKWKEAAGYRMQRYPGFTFRYCTDKVLEIVDHLAYFLEDKHEMPLGAIALAWVYLNPFVFSTFVGGTCMKHFVDNFDALNINCFHPDLFTIVEDYYTRHPEPTKGVLTYDEQPKASLEDSQEKIVEERLAVHVTREFRDRELYHRFFNDANDMEYINKVAKETQLLADANKARRELDEAKKFGVDLSRDLYQELKNKIKAAEDFEKREIAEVQKLSKTPTPYVLDDTKIPDKTKEYWEARKKLMELSNDREVMLDMKDQIEKMKLHRRLISGETKEDVDFSLFIAQEEEKERQKSQLLKAKDTKSDGGYQVGNYIDFRLFPVYQTFELNVVLF